MIRSSWVSTFLIVEIEPSDKEQARWFPVMSVIRRSMKKSVMTGS
jgi:hypothetical protein